MALSAHEAPGSRSKSRGLAIYLTGLIILLGAVASLGGLCIPGLYRDSPNMVAQAIGQDWVTLLVALPALAVTLFYVGRGSARATLAWIGLLGYMLYTYTTYAFGTAFNEFFLIYVALFSLSIFATLTAASSIDVESWPARFDAGTPCRPVAAFLALCGLMVLGLWLPEIFGFLATGELPKSMVLAEIPTNFVYVMDLGIVVPLALLTAVWLWQRSPWGYVLAGAVLFKASTMGLALLSMVWFMARNGQPVALPPAVMAAVVATGGLGMAAWFIRHCHEPGRAPAPAAQGEEAARTPSPVPEWQPGFER